MPGELKVELSSPVEILDAAAIAVLEANADRLLDEKGIEVGDIALAQKVWAGTGARLIGNRMHVPLGLARDIVLRHARSRFVQLGRDRAHDVRFGDGSLIAAPAYGPPFVDWGEGRRMGSAADFDRVLSLVEATPVLRHAGGMVGDVGGDHPATRHLHQIAASLKRCAKPLLGPAPSAAAYRDALELARIALGKPGQGVHLLNLVNSNSPLRFRKGMLRALVETSRLEQGLLLTAYCVPGLTAPVTLAGAMSQGLAEILFGAATAYLVNAGACIIAGIIPVPFSMASMRPDYGQPATVTGAYAGAQLIRRLGLPCRVDGGPTSAKKSDDQAGREAGFGLRSAVDARADFILHAAGWLDNGLLFGGEKFAQDLACLASLFGALEAVPSAQPLDASVSAEIDRFVRSRSDEIRASAELAELYATPA